MYEIRTEDVYESFSNDKGMFDLRLMIQTN